MDEDPIYSRKFAGENIFTASENIDMVRVIAVKKICLLI